MFKVLKKKAYQLRLNKLLTNQFESYELREHFKKKYEINIGMYSYGCFVPGNIPKGTSIGRYCSFAENVRILSRNHGLEYISLHPYLFNSELNIIEKDSISHTKCVISDDVWIGYGAIITPRVSSIGRGAMIGAGAVVTKNVPPYAIVAGNPAKIVRYRFTPAEIAEIEDSKWWMWDKRRLQTEFLKNKEALIAPAAYINNNGKLPFRTNI